MSQMNFLEAAPQKDVAQYCEVIGGMGFLVQFGRKLRGLGGVDRLFLRSMLSKIAVHFRMPLESLQEMFPESLYVKETDGLARPSSREWDLPSKHYVLRGKLQDKLAAALLFDWRPALDSAEVQKLDPEDFGDHPLQAVLFATRVHGSRAAALVTRQIGLAHTRRLVALYEDGHAHGWHAPWYAHRLNGCIEREQKFFSALRDDLEFIRTEG